MKTYTGFTIEFLESIGVCGEGLERVRAFGGEIDNTPWVWRNYIADYPEAWTAPVFIAQYLISRGGGELDSDFVWQIARISFRELGKLIPKLAQYGKTLSEDNWREAADAATKYADSATSFAAADAARDAAAAAFRANAAARADAEYADYAARAAVAVAARAGARAVASVKAEIVDLAVAALSAY
jgi:hypothetical protein